MLNRYKARTAIDQAMVDFMVQNERFTYRDLEQNVVSTQSRRSNLVSSLARKKLIFEVGKENGRKVWATKKEAIGRAAAKLKRDSIDGKIWAAIRTLGVFTPNEVFAVCEQDDGSFSLAYVRKFCQKLLSAKYFKVVEKARSGGRPARFQLLRDTGPLPPSVRLLECVIDGNTDKVMFVAGDRL